MLSLLVFFPSVFGLGLFFLPRKWVSKTALLGACLQFLLSCSLFALFDPTSAELQLSEKASLVPFLGLKYFLALDGISFWYVLLSSFLLPLVFLFSNRQSPLYYFLLFCTLSLSNGAFLSFDGLLFYIFFEVSLIPLFLMIFFWGGEERLYAGFKFLIYTFFSSLFLLGGFVYLSLLHKKAHGEMSSLLTDLYLLDLPFSAADPFSPQTLAFFCFAFAFAVKTPLIPFHTWLPLAHVQAPTGASVYLSAIILKLGSYGWFRFVFPLFPEASHHYSPILLFLAVSGLIYCSALAFAQKDIKRLIAYSSIAHMAYTPIGLFAFNLYGLKGAFYQTLCHGLSSAGLFLSAGLALQRTKSLAISHYGGMIKSMPLFGLLFFLIGLSSIGLPLTGGFIAEFLTLLGSFVSKGPWVWFAITGTVLGAIYILNLFQKMFLGPANEKIRQLKDLNLREALGLTPLALLLLCMGILPGLFFKFSDSSLRHLSQHRETYSLSLYEEGGAASLFSPKNLESKKESSPHKEQAQRTEKAKNQTGNHLIRKKTKNQIGKKPKDLNGDKNQ